MQAVIELEAKQNAPINSKFAGLNYLHQDILEYVIFNGSKAREIAANINSSYSEVADALAELRDRDLVVARLDDEGNVVGWIYSGGKLSDFFLYTQTEGMRNEIQG